MTQTTPDQAVEEAKQEIKIGPFTLRWPVTVTANSSPPWIYENAFWLEYETGEGLSIRESQMIGLMGKYFEENF